MTKPKTPIPATLNRAIYDLYYAPSGLRSVFQEWNEWGGRVDREDFVRGVKALIRRATIFCSDCDDIMWADNAATVRDCPGEPSRRVCRACSSLYEYCFPCDASYPQEPKHVHPSCCGAPHPHFTFPADGHGVVQENERLTVELAKGTIDEEGIDLIKKLVRYTLRYHITTFSAFELVDSVGPLWQAKRGNFTKRLSSAVHSKYKLKLTPDVVSKIGNIARDHSSDTATWHVEFTRDLNLPAADFFHETSCWWGSYSESRCCLKSWGGLALRTYSDAGKLTGRVWVQPLNSNLQPTHDALNAHAYALYNGYGALSGYSAARIVAHLAGRTYRKVGLTTTHCYVNDSRGYLVADDATCKDTSSLEFKQGRHDTLDAKTFDAKETAA